MGPSQGAISLVEVCYIDGLLVLALYGKVLLFIL